jgi:hypothetical protein
MTCANSFATLCASSSFRAEASCSERASIRESNPAKFIYTNLPPPHWRATGLTGVSSAKRHSGLLAHTRFSNVLLLGRDWKRRDPAPLLLPPVTSPEVQSLVPSRVVRIVHKRALGLLFPAVVLVACSGQGRERNLIHDCPPLRLGNSVLRQSSLSLKISGWHPSGYKHCGFRQAR